MINITSITEETMLSDQERDDLLSNRPAEMVTKDLVNSKIVAHAFWKPYENSTLTVCVITLINGFEIVGESACANAANFDADLGKKLAYDDAVNKIFKLEGYVLRELLYLKSQIPAPPAQEQSLDVVVEAPTTEEVTAEVSGNAPVEAYGMPEAENFMPDTQEPAPEVSEPIVEQPEETPLPTPQDIVEPQAPLSNPVVQPAEGESTQPQQDGVQQQQQQG